MDKLDVWIYIILFVVIPIVNSLLGSKKKREAKNVRPESPQPKNNEEWWEEVEEKWEELFEPETLPQEKMSPPVAKEVIPSVQAKPDQKKETPSVQQHTRLHKPLKPTHAGSSSEKDVYAMDKDEVFSVDRSELRKAVVMSEILAKKF